MLIKLTAVSNPDVDNGAVHPVYIDATRILFIGRAELELARRGQIEIQRAAQWKLWETVQALNEKAGGYIPDPRDPVAMEWMMQVRDTSLQVQAAYNALGNAVRDQSVYHPRIPCTEIQLACGTALEHGVMLAKVWVTESPEEVAMKIGRGIVCPRCNYAGGML